MTCRNLKSFSIRSMVTCEQSEIASHMAVRNKTSVQTTVGLLAPSVSSLYQRPAADAYGKSKNETYQRLFLRLDTHFL